MGRSLEPLKKLTPNSGAYINEVCGSSLSMSPSQLSHANDCTQGFLFEKEWQKTFWGDNYERLLKIKKKVDPKNVLVCFPCVGSEGWKQNEDGRLCRE